MTKSPDASYRFLAAGHIRRQAKQLAEQLDGVRTAEDIECLHRARVASRRLRAALKMFSDCFRGKTVRRWRKQVRRVTRKTGDARDKDVQIDFLCGALAANTDKRCFPGIARLLAKLEQEREALQSKVSKAVDRLAKGKVLEQMQSVTKPLLAPGKSSEVKGFEPGDYSDFVCAQTRRHVLRRLGKMLRYQDSLQDSCDQRRHHAMRIAAKRLRYTIELARPVYGQSLDEAVAAVKRVQTLLGEVHDCDVWVDRVDIFAKAERRRIIAFFGGAGRFARLEPGIQCLRQERQLRRGQVFEELVAYWQELRRQGLWEELSRRMDRPESAGKMPVPPGRKASSDESGGTGVSPVLPEDTGKMPVPPVGDVEVSPPGAAAAETPVSAADAPGRVVRRELTPVALSKSNGR